MGCVLTRNFQRCGGSSLLRSRKAPLPRTPHKTTTSDRCLADNAPALSVNPDFSESQASQKNLCHSSRKDLCHSQVLLGFFLRCHGKFSPTFPADCLKSFKSTSKLVYVWEGGRFNHSLSNHRIRSLSVVSLLQVRFGHQEY